MARYWALHTPYVDTVLETVLSQKYQLRAIWKQERRSNTTTTTQPTTNMVNVVIKAKIDVNRNTQIISNRYSTNLYISYHTRLKSLLKDLIVV